MSNRHPYPKAPITEAIIDIRVVQSEGFTFEALGHLNPGGLDYPTKDQIFRVGATAEFRRGESPSASAEQSLHGFKFSRADGTQIWQAHKDGFTFSRLEPYESWEPFRDEARRIWKIYREGLNPEAITRIAVRTINRIDIPEPEVDLKDYFQTSPEIAPELPQLLEGFFMQLRIPLHPINALTIINQTIAPPQTERTTSIILDIDIYRSTDAPQDETEIWELFEALRKARNEIFEACITDKTRRLFENADHSTTATA